MTRTGIIPATLFFAAFSMSGFSAAAQSDTKITQDTPKLVRVSPNEDYLPMPPAKQSLAIEVRSMDKVSEETRRLVASAEPAIAERAGLWGLELNQGKWIYEQVSCPALPDHVFLRFTRNQGPGDTSIFTASIPRNGGQVRTMPLVLRGYALYTPAQMNPLTISTFNRISSEEKLGKTSDWLAVSLCYASLAGSNAQIDFPDPPNDQPKATFPAWTSVVKVLVAGDVVVEFTDIGAKPQPMQWTLTYDPHGRLVTAQHEAVTTMRVMEIHNEPTEPQGPASRSKNADQPEVPVIRAKDSTEPDGPVIHTPNNDSLPAPKSSQPAPKQ